MLMLTEWTHECILVISLQYYLTIPDGRMANKTILLFTIEKKRKKTEKIPSMQDQLK